MKVTVSEGAAASESTWAEACSKMACLLHLPGDVQSCVAELARFEPTPSAAALRARLEECPWISHMIEQFPDLCPSLILLHAPVVGLHDCRKCSSCAVGTLHGIRRQFDPELADSSDEEGDTLANFIIVSQE